MDVGIQSVAYILKSDVCRVLLCLFRSFILHSKALSICFPVLISLFSSSVEIRSDLRTVSCVLIFAISISDVESRLLKYSCRSRRPLGLFHRNVSSYFLYLSSLETVGNVL